MYKATTDIEEVRKYLSGATTIAFDFETGPEKEYRDEEKAALDPHKTHIVGVSFSNAAASGIYIPIAHKAGPNANMDTVINLLSEFAANPEIIKVAHNLSFESMFLYKHGIVIQPPVYDTIAAAQMTQKSNTTYRTLADSGLKTLVPELLDIELPTFSEVTGGRFFDELDPLDKETVRYACADSDYTLRLYHMFNDWFDRWLPKHRNIVEEVESPTAVYVGLMKHNGLLVDKELMEDKAAECEYQLAMLRDEIAFIIGDINIGANASTSAFKNYLYKDLGLPVLKTTTKYQEAADDEALILLTEWCEMNRPDLTSLFSLVQEYRRWGKIKSTYVDGYKKYINTATKRIHAYLFPLATETGRFAARNPNLQNMPQSDNDVIGVRNFFIAPEGSVLLSLDFSQIELRVGAFYCRDEKMLETYRTGGDIHAQTTSVIYDIPLEQAANKHAEHYKERRTIAKNVNFGTFYGLFPNGLHRTLKFKAGLNTPLEECERIIYSLKSGYPKLSEWQEDIKSTTRSKRYVETWLGRRRYLKDINSLEWGKRTFAERCALNSPIQGTAADILKLALGRIIQGLPEHPWIKPLLQIHDEVLFEVPVEMINEAINFIKHCMEQQPFPEFDIPIVAEAVVGQRFGKLKELEENS